MEYLTPFRTLRGIAGLVFAMTTAGSSLFAAGEGEPVSLFEGKTLAGWEYDPEIWRIEDGVITGGSTTEKVTHNAFISTEKSFHNFELTLTIKCSGDPKTGMINSGIQIRSARVPGGTHMSGYQVDCGKGWFGKIYDEFRRNKVIATPIDAAALEKVVDVYGWNEYRIRAEGPRIRVWINGVAAIDYTEKNPDIALDGKIAPQIHSGGKCLVQFKDVTIKELPPAVGASTWKSLGGVRAAIKKAKSNPKAKPAANRPKEAAARAPGKKTQSPRTEAYSPEKELAGFTVPEGFVIELVASEQHGVINPIDLTFDDAGRLWTQTARMYPLDPVTDIKWGQLLALMNDPAAQAKNPQFKRVRDLYQRKTAGTDRILILEDPTRPASGPLHVWADGLTIPQSILPYKDGAYVAHGSELFLLRDTDQDGKADKTEAVLTGFGFTDTHTMAHLLIRGPGGWINFSQGALNKSTVSTVASGNQVRLDYSCQARFSLDHKQIELVSTGPNNMWGFQLRSSGQWYGSEANDLGMSVIPLDPGTALRGIGNPTVRRYQPILPELHAFRVGGTGLSGLAFADDRGGSFPDQWKDVALLANPITSTINAVRVTRNADGTVEAEHLADFLSSEDDWFRPVNLEFGPDGCLYVADFYNKIVSHNEVSRTHPDRDKNHGRIWRIRHRSQTPRAIPNLTKAPTHDLLAHLSSPSLWEQRAAWHQLVDRKAVEFIPGLVALAADTDSHSTERILALWCLEGLVHYDAPLIAALLKVSDSDLRREAVRSLASFDLEAAEVAALIADHIEDPHCLVRSQALRTLGEINRADSSTVRLLISASKPALDGNALGGPYERSFERYLARMALEKYPAQLKAYLNSEQSSAHPAQNILWAIQALPEEDKQQAFLGIWEKVRGGKLDAETFVAIASMLVNKRVVAAVRDYFQDPDHARDLVFLATRNQSRVQSPQLAKILTPAVTRLLASPDDLRLGLTAVSQLKLKGLRAELAKITPAQGDVDTARLLLAAQAVEPKLYAARFQEILRDHDQPFALRLEALYALAPVDPAASHDQLSGMLPDADADRLRQITTALSRSKAGAALLVKLHQSKLLPLSAFDLSAAERTQQAHSRDPAARAILVGVRKRVAQDRQQAQARVKKYLAAVDRLTGDPAKGRTTFTACLTCHQVGTEGQDIAPPLDGSGHRELEHLLTAIVDPDAAVEGGHGLYRITKRDDTIIEGHLEKEEPRGTTIAVMGGTRLFVPNSEIRRAGFVGGRSFMLPSFGQLAEQDMVDLIAYIKTLR